jgi:hypothetical protein
MIGGVFSIILKIVYMIYLSYLLAKMFLYQEDKTYSWDYDLKKDIVLNLKETNL